MPLQLGGVAVESLAGPRRRPRTPSSRSCEPGAATLEDAQPDLAASVREKNAKRTSKVSSSHAAGPVSVISVLELLLAVRR